jgi:hypothetical protein
MSMFFIFPGIDRVDASHFPVNPPVEETTDDHQMNAAEIKRGERLFYGLAYDRPDVPACADCHNTVEIDTLNWNPSAYEIASKYKDRTIADFQKAVLNPVTPTMQTVHAENFFTPEDIATVKGFLDHFAEQGLTPKKPVVTNAIIFGLLTLLIILALVDAFFTWRIKSKFVHLSVILVAIAIQIKLVSTAAIALGRSENYQPDQPIKFSHQVHVTDNQIDCIYCHTTVEYSKSAGIPSANICMNCHILVAEGTHSGRYEIDKLKKAYNDSVPIEWVRVHNLPDHAYFNHAQHVAVGQVECAECHGDVGEMHILRQVEDLSMGWCLECHRTREVTFMSNEFYQAYIDLHEAIRKGEKETVTVEDIGGTGCMKCHY